MLKTLRSFDLRTGVAMTLLAAAGLLATASASSSSPPPPQSPAQAQAQATPPVQEFQDTNRYRGPHPVHPDFGSGFCERSDLHGEPYPPFEPELFAQVGGAWVFVGDPGDFDSEGSAYWYANPHPFPEEYGGDWCHYPWPHRHHFQLVGDPYDVIGGFIYFVGAFTDAFYGGVPRKRAFFRHHYRSHYHRGALYRRHRPRYARVGRNRYRRLYPRRPGGFRPYRPRTAQVPSRGGRLHRPGTVGPTHGPGAWSRRPDRQGWSRRPDRQGWQRRPSVRGWRRAFRPGRPATGITRGRGLPVRDGMRRPQRSPRRGPLLRRRSPRGPRGGSAPGARRGLHRRGTSSAGGSRARGRSAAGRSRGRSSGGSRSSGRSGRSGGSSRGRR